MRINYSLASNNAIARSHEPPLFSKKMQFSIKKFIKRLAEQKECSTFAPRLRENAAANEIAKEVWVSG